MLERLKKCPEEISGHSDVVKIKKSLDKKSLDTVMLERLENLWKKVLDTVMLERLPTGYLPPSPWKADPPKQPPAPSVLTSKAHSCESG